MVEFIRAAGWVFAAYGVLGLLFAGAFQWRGLGTLDEGTREAGIGFRLLITPGVVALWPLIAGRWWRASRAGPAMTGQELTSSPRRLRALHALAWKGLALGVPVLVAAALWWRPVEDFGSRLPDRLQGSNPMPVTKPSR